MAFLSPLFLVAAAAAAIPVLLHLLKREPEARVRFSAVKLLRSAPVEHTSRRHIRELILLALRMAALVMLAVAFARPFLTASGAAAASGVTMIALDTSLSTSAPAQFARARGLARAAIDRAPKGDAVGVVLFADQARVAAAPTTDRGAARSVIDAAVAVPESTSYRAALSAASQAIAGRAGRIVVVTDLLDNGWDAGERAVLPASTTIEVVDIGPPPPNLSVTSARVAGDRVLAAVHNAGPQARDAHVQLLADPGSGASRPVGDTKVPVAANATAEVAFARPPGRTASIVVDDPGAVEADNVRYVVLDDPGRGKVLIVGSTADIAHDAFYLQQALAAGGSEVEGAAAAELASWDQARMNTHRAVILTSTKALERRGRELLGGFVRGGGGMLIAGAADVDGQVVSDTLGVQLVMAAPSASQRDMQVRSLAPADVRHPIFQMFGGGASSLGLVQFHRVSSIRASGCGTLARFTTGETAIADCAVGDGRVLILASDLDNRWNDFPLHATFVPFVHEAVRYLAGSQSRASEYLVSEAPPGVPHAPGVARLPAGSGREERLVAVNVDPAESMAGRLTADEFQTAVTRLKDAPEAGQQVEAREQEDRQRLWRYLLMAMIAILIVESAVAARTA